MIIIIAGGVGSGKTLTAVKHCYAESKTNKIYTNFKLTKIKNYHRLKWEDILTTEKTKVGQLKNGTPKHKETKKVNWEFWSKNKNADIFLDEVHNIVNSRKAMSNKNILFSEWISQIRKIWGQSGDVAIYDQLQKLPNNVFNKVIDKALSRSNNIYLITQKIRKIDVNFKELCHAVCMCKKVKLDDNHLIIINEWYFGNDMHDAVEMMELGKKPKKCFFLGNKYFGHYDSYEIIGMETEYL